LAATLVWRARHLLQRGDILQALTQYSRVIALQPGCGTAVLELARLRANLGDFVEAERLYARAIRSRNLAAEAYRERALTRRRRGLTPAALSDLMAAVDLEPDNVSSIRQLASWYIEIRAWAAALAQYRALLRVLSDTAPNAELKAARLKTRALVAMAAETDPVANGDESHGWVRRSMSLLAQH
jgi:tetratricopeptide (TPR) repeat protein